MMQFITATSNDLHIVRDIANECWPVAYRGIIEEEQISYMLDMMYSEESLHKQLTERCEFVIASQNDNPVGFASFSTYPDGKCKLHKLYLYSHQKGKGTGRLLINEVAKRARQQGAQSLELQVNKSNPAVSFYKKNGFSIKEEAVFDIGSGFVMDDYIMSKELT
jgi:ribosomal protein S18 acetylase RimI-like enzyme